MFGGVRELQAFGLPRAFIHRLAGHAGRVGVGLAVASVRCRVRLRKLADQGRVRAELRLGVDAVEAVGCRRVAVVDQRTAYGQVRREVGLAIQTV